MDHKIGVYIDTGYGIGEALDIEALSKVATEEFKVRGLPRRTLLERSGQAGHHQERHSERRPDCGHYCRPFAACFPGIVHGLTESLLNG